LFLDFDGTLVDLAERPTLVRVPQHLKDLLVSLQSGLQGAVAIVTGRDIQAIDLFLAPLLLPVSGVHGLVRRDARGTIHDQRIDRGLGELLAERLRSFVAANDGVLLERKTGSVALHYRARPEAEAECFAAMQAAIAEVDGVRLMFGKMMVEAMTGGVSKGSGIAEFLAEPPFAGRVPVFAGDDVTDEDAFRETNARGGLTIKIGPGETLAQFRFDSIAAFHRFLASLAARLQQAPNRDRG